MSNIRLNSSRAGPIRGEFLLSRGAPLYGDEATRHRSRHMDRHLPTGNDELHDAAACSAVHSTGRNEMEPWQDRQ